MRRPNSFLFLLVLNIGLNSALLARDPGPATGKVPDWVSAFKADYSRHGLDSDADDGYVDLLFEKQVRLADETVYYRKAIRILTEAGVQNRSEISISYDPSYNKLVIHSIRILRGKKVINKLKPERFRIIQQESELSRFLYNGSLSAVLILDDVRKGDIIEYSYSISGFNPVFGGKYDDQLDTRFSVPVYNLHYRILFPANRKLNIRNHLINARCRRQKKGKELVYDWHFENVPALHPEDRLPAWYDPYSVIMVSEYENWNAVSRWAAGLFPLQKKLSPALKSKIASIRKSSRSRARQFLSALRFVQDDIRYMGIEMGENSHRPNSPDEVYRQRFGDCKDKSYLLVTMARALGIDASPVLINSTAGQSLRDWLPSAGAFDHVVVRAELNGLSYWFDPTISYQRGQLDDIDFPDYGYGLVVSDSTQHLSVIPAQGHGLVDIKEIFRIPNTSGTARLEIKTVYSGSYADNIRSDFHNNSLYAIRQNYQDFYSTYFDHIKIDSLSWEDKDPHGRLTTYEFYSISDFWESAGGRKKAYFTPFIIEGLLKKPRDSKRKMPFSIAHPAHYREEIIAHLPEDWTVKDESDSIRCNAFELFSKCSYVNRKLRLNYEYRSLKDHVAPGEESDFLSKYTKADNSIHYELNCTDTVKAAPLILPPAKPVAAVPLTGHSENNYAWYIPAFTLLLAGLFFWWGRRRV